MTTQIATRVETKPSRRRKRRGSTPFCDVHGWMSCDRPYPEADEPSHLAQHADWAGPIKLISNGAACRRVAQLRLSESQRQSGDLGGIEADQQIDQLIRAMLKTEPKSRVEGWEPPAAHSLSRWLEDAGYTSAVDDTDQLRVALSRRGRDGTVHLRSEPGLLRVEMSLGDWGELDAVAEKAMYYLACRANARVHLARIAWLKSDGRLRCDAQVDLSGVPIEPLGILPQMLSVAIAAMQLTLDQLGLELDMLATAKDPGIAEEVLASSTATRTRPGPKK